MLNGIAARQRIEMRSFADIRLSTALEDVLTELPPLPGIHRSRALSNRRADGAPTSDKRCYDEWCAVETMHFSSFGRAARNRSDDVSAELAAEAHLSILNETAADDAH